MANVNVDYRERDLLQILESGNFEYTRSNLPVGDVHISKNNNHILIERKTLDDYSSSIVDGRYNDQKSRLLESGAQIVYIIEGMSKNNHGVPLSTLYSAIYSSQVRDNIVVLRSLNIEDTVKYVEMLVHKIDMSKECQTLKVFKKSQHSNVYIEMLCCIPGVSITIANNIANTFPTIDNLINHIKDVNSITCVSKIGTKLSVKIINYLMHNKHPKD